MRGRPNLYVSYAEEQRILSQEIPKAFILFRPRRSAR